MPAALGFEVVGDVTAGRLGDLTADEQELAEIGDPRMPDPTPLWDERR
jgi:hypothetical protein